MKVDAAGGQMGTDTNRKYQRAGFDLYHKRWIHSLKGSFFDASVYCCINSCDHFWKTKKKKEKKREERLKRPARMLCGDY